MSAKLCSQLLCANPPCIRATIESPPPVSFSSPLFSSLFFLLSFTLRSISGGPVFRKQVGGRQTFSSAPKVGMASTSAMTATGSEACTQGRRGAETCSSRRGRGGGTGAVAVAVACQLGGRILFGDGDATTTRERRWRRWWRRRRVGFRPQKALADGAEREEGRLGRVAEQRPRRVRHAVARRCWRLNPGGSLLKGARGGRVGASPRCELTPAIYLRLGTCHLPWVLCVLDVTGKTEDTSVFTPPNPQQRRSLIKWEPRVCVEFRVKQFCDDGYTACLNLLLRYFNSKASQRLHAKNIMSSA